MDWTAVTTILATGVVTLTSVGLKGFWDDRSAKRQLIAAREAKSAELDRADAREIRDRDAANLIARRDGATAAVTEFASILSALEVHPDYAPAIEIEQTWLTLDSRGRQAAEQIHDTEAREAIVRMMNALADFTSFADDADLNAWRGHEAKSLVRCMIELAGAAARVEPPTPRLEARVRIFLEQWSLHLKRIKEVNDEANAARAAARESDTGGQNQD